MFEEKRDVKVRARNVRALSSLENGKNYFFVLWVNDTNKRDMKIIICITLLSYFYRRDVGVPLLYKTNGKHQNRVGEAKR